MCLALVNRHVEEHDRRATHFAREARDNPMAVELALLEGWYGPERATGFHLCARTGLPSRRLGFVLRLDEHARTLRLGYGGGAGHLRT